MSFAMIRMGHLLGGTGRFAADVKRGGWPIEL